MYYIRYIGLRLTTWTMKTVKGTDSDPQYTVRMSEHTGTAVMRLFSVIINVL